MDANNNLTSSQSEEKYLQDVDSNQEMILQKQQDSKVKCESCGKSFFKDFIMRHMRVSHPGLYDHTYGTEHCTE